jgi:hypothetical protein
MATEAAGGTGTSISDQAVVAGVFSDHSAGMAALGKLEAMGPQLRDAGVTGVLILAKDADGKVDARAAELPGASESAEELEKQTIAALESMAGVQGHPDAPAAELGHALRPGAIALAVFVSPDRAAVVRMGLQNIGAQVLTDDDLRRIGAGAAGVSTSGLQGGETSKGSVPAPSPVFDWQGEYAYTLAVQALIYGFPYVYGAQTRYTWVAQTPSDPEVNPHPAVNRFWHAARVTDATWRDGGCPNNDTMYSISWVDLSQEPVILSHPDMGDRYFTFQLAAMTSDNFDFVGRRTTGSKAGHFALVGPGWTGELPDGVGRIEPSPTPWILVGGRTLVDGAEDVSNVRALQQQYKLTPLSLWGTDQQVPERRDVLQPIEVTKDPLGPWKTLNAMLAENPPPPEHAILLKQFATIGIGPGLDVDAQPDNVKENLVRALGAGMQLLKQQFLSGAWATVVNGWRYPPRNEGRFGDELLLRAADQSLAGIVANDPEEAVYLVNFTDDSGAKFSGDSRYELQFAGDNLPPVDAFWSLTMYAADYNLVANPANRYSIGDRTPGVVKDADGGMTLYIQAASPGADKEPNWLPCPGEGTWFLILRMYQPRDEVVQATWRCPAVRNAS